jgi:hypothetical protein
VVIFAMKALFVFVSFHRLSVPVAAIGDTQLWPTTTSLICTIGARSV